MSFGPRPVTIGLLTFAAVIAAAGVVVRCLPEDRVPLPARVATEAATVVALDRHLARLSPGAKASATGLFNYYRADFPDPGGRVLAVIPTRDRLDLLRPCIESLRATARPDDLDILVVDHLSQDPATRAWLAAPPPGVAVLRVEGPFNYAAINNAAVAHARARPGELPPFLLFANNDIEAREPPISGLPSITFTVPSGVMFSETQVLPPKLNQKPQETPRPWFGPSFTE